MIGMPTLRFLDKHMLRGRQNLRLLDIGAQNAMSLEVPYMMEFLARYGCKETGDALKAVAEQLVDKSFIKPGVATLYLSEIFDHTTIRYDAFDIAPAPKTIIFDLNKDALPAAMRGAYDIVLNLGTTEHVMDQDHCMRIIHDVTKVGGQMFHQVPASGWLEHGFFSYHPRFFTDMARTNQYDVESIFLYAEREIPLKDFGIPLRLDTDYTVEVDFENNPAYASIRLVRAVNVNALLRRKTDKPFALPLETDTSHAQVDSEIIARYESQTSSIPAPVLRCRARFIETLRAIKAMLK